MPLLQFQTSLSLTEAERTSLADVVTETYASEMRTGTDHVAVTIRQADRSELFLGRSVPGPLLLLDAEIRRGRPFEYKRAFATAVMEWAAATHDVPDPNMKVVFTEHAGENMMGVSRVGGEWDGAE